MIVSRIVIVITYNAYYKNDDSYEDVLEAFIEEAISATTPK